MDDGSRRFPSTTVEIQVGSNAAPTAAITAPADESTYRDGVALGVSATGSDAEDGTLPESAFQWQIRLHHATHIHEYSSFPGRTGSFTPATDHDADSYYEIRLTVTDSGGRSTTKTVDVRPQTVQLTLASTPTGAPLSYDGQTAVAGPLTKTVAIGYKPFISAADTFTSAGLTQSFQTWSDSGARTHQITVPSSNTTLTATYGAATGGTDVLKFTPDADTWVDQSNPKTSYGTSSRFTADASPVSQSLVSFPVSGLAGRKVVGVKLRMFQKDASPLGGRVFPISSNSWTEATTWENRPAIDGSLAASFGAVSAENWYTVDLGAGFVTGDGRRSLAIDSTSNDGSRWASRQSSTPPELLVEVEKSGTPPPPPPSGLSTVASAPTGSTEPTYFAGNHRLVTTAGGRTLALHGRNGSGVQLAWRDPGSSWRTASTGAVADGQLSSNSGTGNWPASIATARDADGVERAYVVWSAPSYATTQAVYMVRLSDLDSPSGPRVGSTSTVDAPVLGAYRADVGFERAADGSSRGVLVWSRRATEDTYEIVTAWFTDLRAEVPPLVSRKAIYSTTSSSNRFGSLVPNAAGMRIVARGSSSVLRVYKHDTAAALDSWQSSSGGAAVAAEGSPSGIALSSGDTLTASDNGSGGVLVQRFTAAIAPVAPELQLSGYRHPVAGHRRQQGDPGDDPGQRRLRRLARALVERGVVDHRPGRDRRGRRRQLLLAERRAHARRPPPGPGARPLGRPERLLGALLRARAHVLHHDELRAHLRRARGVGQAGAALHAVGGRAGRGHARAARRAQVAARPWPEAAQQGPARAERRAARYVAQAGQDAPGRVPGRAEGVGRPARAARARALTARAEAPGAASSARPRVSSGGNLISESTSLEPPRTWP